MTDDDTRELERRYHQSNALEDGVAWLLARVRAGETTRAMLEASARLGDPVSRHALGDDAPPVFSGDDWGELTAELPPEAARRAALAGARAALPVWERGAQKVTRPIEDWGDDELDWAALPALPGAVLADAERLLVTSDDELRARVDVASWQVDECSSIAQHWAEEEESEALAGVGNAAQAIHAAARAVVDEDVASDAGTALEYAMEALARESGQPSAEQVRAAVRKGVLAWALGTGDPLTR